jgi:hypothetical protein
MQNVSAKMDSFTDVGGICCVQMHPSNLMVVFLILVMFLSISL